MHENQPIGDPLSVAGIRAQLDARRFGRRLEVHPVLGSTQDRCRALALAGAPAGTAVLAEAQTAGRGRRGQRWCSAPGLGLWMSVVVPAAGHPPGVVTLSCAVAVRRGIRAAGGPPLDVKWPNDLELGGRKVCGILIEAFAGKRAVLGVGVNVHHAAGDLPPSLRDRATALDAAVAQPLERNRLAARVLEALEETFAALDDGQAAELLAAWRAACGHLGAAVRIEGPVRTVTGIAEDIDAAGALRVRRPGGALERLLAGRLRRVDRQ